MSTLYISNLGSEIHLDMDNIHLKYLGTKVFREVYMHQ